jgi:hypothetical protein
VATASFATLLYLCPERNPRGVRDPRHPALPLPFHYYPHPTKGSVPSTMKTITVADMRKPYRGPTRSLVIALDVGTTFSGVSYAILEPGEVPKIHGVTRYERIT